jgi:hypothetical protein
VGAGAVGIVGDVLLAVGAVLHVTSGSPVRVVKTSLRLRPASQSESDTSEAPKAG